MSMHRNTRPQAHTTDTGAPEPARAGADISSYVSKATAHLDSVEAVVGHVHAQEHAAAGTAPKVLDHHVLVHKGAPPQLGQLQAGRLPARRRIRSALAELPVCKDILARTAAGTGSQRCTSAAWAASGWSSPCTASHTAQILHSVLCVSLDKGCSICWNAKLSALKLGWL